MYAHFAMDIALHEVHASESTWRRYLGDQRLRKEEVSARSDLYDILQVESVHRWFYHRSLNTDGCQATLEFKAWGIGESELAYWKATRGKCLQQTM